MFQLVNGYFKKNAGTSDFFIALMPSLKEARDFIEIAIRSFDAADEDDQPLKTLDELRQYFFVGGTGEFESVYQEQLSMFGELQNKKVEQERKLKSAKIGRKIGRKISCIIFVSVFAALLISAFVVSLKASPRVAAAMAVASSIPLGSMGKWFGSMLKDYQDALKVEMKLINIMLDWTCVVGTHLDNIRNSVKRVEDSRKSLLDYAKFLLKDEDPVRLGIEEMRKKMGEFMKSIEDLMQQADRCSKDIRRARTAVLQEIIQLHT